MNEGFGALAQQLMAGESLDSTHWERLLDRLAGPDALLWAVAEGPEATRALVISLVAEAKVDGDFAHAIVSALLKACGESASYLLSFLDAIETARLPSARVGAGLEPALWGEACLNLAPMWLSSLGPDALGRLKAALDSPSGACRVLAAYLLVQRPDTRGLVRDALEELIGHRMIEGPLSDWVTETLILSGGIDGTLAARVRETLASGWGTALAQRRLVAARVAGGRRRQHVLLKGDDGIVVGLRGRLQGPAMSVGRRLFIAYHRIRQAAPPDRHLSSSDEVGVYEIDLAHPGLSRTHALPMALPHRPTRSLGMGRRLAIQYQADNRLILHLYRPPGPLESEPVGLALAFEPELGRWWAHLQSEDGTPHWSPLNQGPLMSDASDASQADSDRLVQPAPLEGLDSHQDPAPGWHVGELDVAGAQVKVGEALIPILGVEPGESPAPILLGVWRDQTGAPPWVLFGRRALPMGAVDDVVEVIYR